MSAPDLGPSAVTIKDLWQAQQSQTDRLADAINAVERALERLTGHLDAIDQRNLASDRQHADFETRLRALERWRYALPASLLLGLGSAGAAILTAVHRLCRPIRWPRTAAASTGPPS